MSGGLQGLRGRRAAAGASALALALVAATAAFAGSAGDLDSSFGKHGLRIVRDANEGSQAVAVGRHGRIVVVGGRTVVRLRPDGRLDRGFAADGIATLPPARIYGPGYSSLAVSRRGGVFAAAQTCNADETRCGFAVSHLRRNGEVDRSFGQNGTASVKFPVPASYSPYIAIARGGKPVVTGLICRSFLRDCDLALARLDRSGRLDPAFGDGGKVVASAGRGGKCPNRRSQTSPMALDSHGRIVIGAFCARTVSLARFEPNGRRDRSFGRGGEVNKEHLRLSAVTALAIDRKDRIDVAGPRPRDAYGVARFQPNGKVDFAFGHQGKAGVTFEKHADRVSPYSAAVDSRGRIVLAGGAFGFSFARFTAHGRVDRHFGRHGRVVTGRSVVKGGSGQGLRVALSVAIDRRDRIVSTGIQRNDRENHFAVIRLFG